MSDRDRLADEHRRSYLGEDGFIASAVARSGFIAGWNARAVRPDAEYREIARLRGALKKIKSAVELIAQRKCAYAHMKGGPCKDVIHCLTSAAASIVVDVEIALNSQNFGGMVENGSTPDARRS